MSFCDEYEYDDEYGDDEDDAYDGYYTSAKIDKILFKDDLITITKGLSGDWIVCHKRFFTAKKQKAINKAIEIQREYFEINKANRISSIMRLTAMKSKKNCKVFTGDYR